MVIASLFLQAGNINDIVDPLCTREIQVIRKLPIWFKHFKRSNVFRFKALFRALKLKIFS